MHDLGATLTSSLGELLGPNIFGTLIAAAFGAFAGAWATSRRETKRAVISELNSISAARMLCFSICNKFLALKRQHMQPVYDQYMESRKRFLQAHQSFQAGNRVPVEFEANLRTITPIWLPTQTLERQIFEKISIRGRALAAATDLVGAIDALTKSMEFRNRLIAEIQQQALPSLQLAEKYYGFRTERGIIDEKFRTNIDALYLQTDDCIFFSRILEQDLFDYGRRLRRRNAWKFRLGIPKMTPADWTIAEKNGMLPDDKDYVNWLRGFKELPGRWERFRNVIRAIAAKLRTVLFRLQETT